MNILSNLHGPEDLRRLSPPELYQLASEMREKMVNTVAGTGGHLAPSLGVVELTIALHLVFQSPRDKIIWDVGHQAYGHKLLTGRWEGFDTLRQQGGLSGFPKRQESEHDAFGTGHASTSISAALGLALARDLQGGDQSVVAVIGDGALTGGMALEALNHAGQLGRRLIVVLNDNEMSISKNVGALASYLSRVRTDPKYYRGKEELETVLRRLPTIGPRLLKVAERLKDSFKYLVVPGMLFEELGYTYLGPIDGHDLAMLREVLGKAKQTPGPVLVHVVTRKGYGYQPAEENPGLFHGIGAFNVQTGQPLYLPGPPAYTAVFGSALAAMAEKDQRVVAITAAMPGGTGLGEFARRFPRRFFDVGIAEQHAVTLAAGLAAGGYRPVVALYSTFLQRAYDQIIHDVCLQDLPVVLAVDRAGIVGEDGETHQGLFDLSYLRQIPRLTVMVPRDERLLRDMLLTALSLPGPSALRYPRDRGEGVLLDDPPAVLPVGKGEVLREGQDLVFLAVGPLVYRTLEAARQLEQDGLSCAVVDARFVKPLDRELILQWAGRTSRMVTVEENILAGGFGSAVLELLAAEGLHGVETLCLGLPDGFVAQGRPAQVREKYGLSAEGLADSVRKRFRLARRRTAGRG